MRASSNEVRYAILVKTEGSGISFINLAEETRLVFPATFNPREKKLLWLKQEVERVIRQHPQIGKVELRTNGYTGTDNGSKRETSYMDDVMGTPDSLEVVAT